MNNQELQAQYCKVHKRRIEFSCEDSQCKIGGYGCSKCLLKGQQHYNCEVFNFNAEDLDTDRKQIIQDFELQIILLMKNISSFFTKGKDIILRQVQLGNAYSIENANQLLELFKEMNSVNEIDDQQSKSLLIGDIWQQMCDCQEYFQQSCNTSKSKQLDSISNSMSNSKSGISLLDQSSLSLKDDTATSISVLSSNSMRKKVLLNNSKQKPLQNMIDEISSMSSLNKSSSNDASSVSSQPPQPSHSNLYRSSKIGTQQQQISLGNFKWKESQKFQIKSQYIDNFCLFETKYQGGSQAGNQIMQRDFETDTDSSSITKKYYLLTRYNVQSLSVFDLQKMKQLHPIQFTNDSEIIHFKQISDTQVIIFSPSNKFFQVQNIFDETQFQQVDFKFAIDCIECDKDQGIIFIGHSLGKISIWDMKKQQMILENTKIHSKKINLMDFQDGRLITCCDSESVKEFVFNKANFELRQKEVLRKELISDCQMESITNLKIINDDTLMVQTQDEFLEIYKNGKKVNDEILEHITCLNDMKVYDKRYGLMRSSEDEHIAVIFDFENLQMQRKQIKLPNSEQVILGAYFINNQIILLLENELILKYF